MRSCNSLRAFLRSSSHRSCISVHMRRSYTCIFGTRGWAYCITFQPRRATLLRLCIAQSCSLHMADTYQSSTPHLLAPRNKDTLPTHLQHPRWPCTQGGPLGLAVYIPNTVLPPGLGIGLNCSGVSGFGGLLGEETHRHTLSGVLCYPQLHVGHNKCCLDAVSLPPPCRCSGMSSPSSRTKRFVQETGL